MERYAGIDHQSGVRRFEIGPHSIAVEFVSGPVYLYTWRSAGKRHVETMKKLAKKGVGLSSYISKWAHEKFERQIDESFLHKLP